MYSHVVYVGGQERPGHPRATDQGACSCRQTEGGIQKSWQQKLKTRELGKWRLVIAFFVRCAVAVVSKGATKDVRYGNDHDAEHALIILPLFFHVKVELKNQCRRWRWTPFPLESSR